MITEKMIPRIEQAVGFPLYDWQKDYLLGNTRTVIGGRRNGNTFAYIVKLLLSDGEPIKRRDLLKYLDGEYGNRRWFTDYVLEINDTLMKAGFETRVVR